MGIFAQARERPSDLQGTSRVSAPLTRASRSSGPQAPSELIARGEWRIDGRTRTASSSGVLQCFRDGVGALGE
jgi:hypothetical protein